MNKKIVKIGGNKSPILISNSIEKDFKRWWQLCIGSHKTSPTIVIIDELVYAKHETKINNILNSIAISIVDFVKIKGGENTKNINSAFAIIDNWSKIPITKESIVICIGGGTITDFGGFVSSIFKRGLNCVFVPTTLMAMTDASLGGKNALNLNNAKNQIGTYHFPKFTFIDTFFLSTLPHSDILSGYAEIMKHALLDSKDFLNYMLNFENTTLIPPKNLLIRSIRVKNKIVNADIHEKNKRILLNLGHTFGHAYESFFANSSNPITHGEAVAFGLAEAVFFSNQLLNLNLKITNNIINWLKKHFEFRNLPNYNNISKFIQMDKKNTEIGIKMILLKSIGTTEVVILNKYICEKIHQEFLSQI